MTSEERTHVLELAQAEPRRHTWVVRDDDVREGKRYTCRICGFSHGPKATGIKGFDPDAPCYPGCHMGEADGDE